MRAAAREGAAGRGAPRGGRGARRARPGRSRALALVNDRVDVARLAGLGVHLGEEDLPAGAARAILPDTAVDRRLDARRRGRPAGLRRSGRGLRGLRAGLREPDEKRAAGPRPRGARAGRPPDGRKPLVAIGGIAAERLDAVWDAGADSAAMIGGLLGGGRIEENARAALDRARRRRRLGRIYLVGFMASGKTTVGRRLAERLGLPFVDLDAEIERAAGRTIRALFEESGEAGVPRAGGGLSRGNGVAAGRGRRDRRGQFRPGASTAGRSHGSEPPCFSTRPSRPYAAASRARRTARSFRAGSSSPRSSRSGRPSIEWRSVRVALSGAETVEEAADRVLMALEDHESLD